MANTQDAQTAYYDEKVKVLHLLASELGVDYACACDVSYLRTRSRWTRELENELISLHKQGIRPNMCEFGSTKETQQKLMKEISNAN